MDALEQMALDLEEAQASRQFDWEDDGHSVSSFWKNHHEFVILKTIQLFRDKSQTYTEV